MVDPEYRPLEFEVIKEDWNYYRLPNGATLKFKAVIQQIFEQVGTSDEITGLPNYTVRSSTIASVTPQEADE